MRETVIHLPGRTLAATILEPRNDGDDTARRPGLLFVHGMGSDQRRYRVRAAAACQQLAAVCLTFDLTGHGQSTRPEAPPRLRDHLADVVAAYDQLESHPTVDPGRIGVCGASYGGYLAARLTAERSVRRLLVRAPGLYDDAALDRSFRDLRPDPDAEASQLFLGLRRSEAEVLVLESEQDEVVPHGVIATYLRDCPRAQHAILAGATHGLTRPEWERQFSETIVRWFRPL